jgi:hypothetical protein
VQLPYSAQLQALDKLEKTRNRRLSPMFRRRDLIVSFRPYGHTPLKSILGVWDYRSCGQFRPVGPLNEITEGME